MPYSYSQVAGASHPVSAAHRRLIRQTASRSTRKGAEGRSLQKQNL
jgi:hypothetical protein